MNENTKNAYKTTGMILPGCMFVGIGLGYLLGDVRIGLFLGMGVGFLVAGFLTIRKTN